jgi:hypothetical protein
MIPRPHPLRTRPALARALWLGLALVCCMAPAASAAEDLGDLEEAYEASVPSPKKRSEEGYQAQRDALECIAVLRTDAGRTTIRRLLLKYGTADHRQAALLLGALVRYGGHTVVNDTVEGAAKRLATEIVRRFR